MWIPLGTFWVFGHRLAWLRRDDVHSTLIPHLSFFHSSSVNPPLRPFDPSRIPVVSRGNIAASRYSTYPAVRSIHS